MRTSPLTTDQVLALDAQLELGAVTETVNVSSEAPLVESRTSDMGQLIESKSISDCRWETTGR